MKPEVIQWLNSKFTDSEFAKLAAGRGKPVQPEKPPPIEPQPTGRLVRVPGVSHEYSTINPFNSKNSALLLWHPGGAVGLHTPDGALHRMLPSVVNHSSHPRWDRKLPNVFYFIQGNALRRFDIGKDWDSDAVSTIKAFTEYETISGGGEMDISLDGDHFVFYSERTIFVYNFIADTKTMEFKVASAFNNVYITPTNHVVVGGYDGTWHADRKGIRRITPSLGHMDIGLNDAGDEVIVWSNSSDRSVNNNGVEAVRLADGQRKVLMGFSWDYALHISVPDALAGGQRKWALISTFAPNKPNDQSEGARAIYRAYLNGSGVELAGQHLGVRNDQYEEQPHAVATHDGQILVYDSRGDCYIQTL